MSDGIIGFDGANTKGIDHNSAFLWRGRYGWPIMRGRELALARFYEIVGCFVCTAVELS